MDSKQAPHEFLLPSHGNAGYLDHFTHATDDLNYVRYSKLTNAVLAGLFGLSMIAHLWQGLRGKCRVFMVMMVLGTAGEMIGHLARLSAEEDAFSSSTMLIQLLAFSAAPISLASGLFVVLVYRIVMLGSNHFSCIKTGAYTWIFAISAVQAVFIQIATMQSTASSDRPTTSGVLLQLATFAAQFSMFTGLISLAGQQKSVDDSKQLLTPIVIASTAFLIRGIYQTSVVVIGPSYPIIQDEMFLINFDSCMCLVVAFVFNFFYPRHLLKHQKPEPTKLPQFEKKRDLLA